MSITHFYSTVFITPAAYVAVVDQLLADLGNGPRSLTVPLYDAQGGVTHYGCRAQSSQDYRQVIPQVIAATDWTAYGLTQAQAQGVMDASLVSVVNVTQPIDPALQEDGRFSPSRHFENEAALLGLMTELPEQR